MFCGWKKPTKEKSETMILWKDISQRSRKANKMKYVYSNFLVQVRAGGLGEEETQAEKEEE